MAPRDVEFDGHDCDIYQKGNDDQENNDNFSVYPAKRGSAYASHWDILVLFCLFYSA
jgi:hypothetical protein